MKVNKILPVLLLTLTLGALSLVSTTTVSANNQEKMCGKNLKVEVPSIVEIVTAEDGEFDVLQSAVIKAGLIENLSGRRPYTVFAPTDAAFIKTLSATNEADAIAKIQALDSKTLKNILLFHITNGRRDSDSILSSQKYRMLNGDFLQKSKLLEAGISKTDIKAKNGLVHVIDSVLLP